MTNTQSRILLTALLCLIALMVGSDEKPPPFDPYLPMAERIKVWDDVVSRELGLPLPLAEPKPYRIDAGGSSATFFKEGMTWTIMGAIAPITDPVVYPKQWPIRGDGFEVVTIPEPITNIKILPFTDNIEGGNKANTIHITAARDSYEPVSLVVRTGNTAHNLTIEVNDLKAKNRESRDKLSRSVLSKELIDIRWVKCWYQAGIELNDVTRKVLTPELLLHNPGLIRVDYQQQVNLINNIDSIEDAQYLLPYSIPARQNQQLWLTIHITKDLMPGNYQGPLRIKSDRGITHELTLSVSVLEPVLPPPIIDYGLYYEGYLSDTPKPEIEAGQKTEKQMQAEYEDMIAHGLTNATVWHRVSQDQSQWNKDWDRLDRTLDIRSKIGWGSKPLLYLDWTVAYRDKPDLYKQKVSKIVSLAAARGIKDAYIYGVDEQIDDDLAKLKPLYQAVHDAGGKNFVAGWLTQLIKHTHNIIDILVINGPVVNKISQSAWANPTPAQIIEVKHKKQKILSYYNPQAGLEQPAIYRQNYGINLYLNGFDGALDYAYQTGKPWNDWSPNKYRPHVMAYPTLSAPVPTLQWEGWRQGVIDVRYFTWVNRTHPVIPAVLAGRTPYSQRVILLNCMKDLQPTNCQ